MHASMDSRNRSKKCSINNCSSSTGSRFFRFPKPDDVRVLQWKLACSSENIFMKDPAILYANNRICSDHFESHFMTGHQLDKRAVPTLNLFQKPKTNDVGTQTESSKKTSEIATQTMNSRQNILHTETQTSQALSSQTPRKERLRNLVKLKSKVIRRLNMENETLGKCCENLRSEVGFITKDIFKNACAVHLPKVLGNLAQIVCDLKDRKAQGRRYTSELKQHALSLYYSSPKAYKKMVKNYYFPSVSTLRRMTENIQRRPGLNDFVFRSLKWRLQEKNREDRICVLSMDEVSLKANLEYDPKNDEIIGFHDLGNGKEFIPAKNALVLMARGVKDNWKQPLGYYFLNTVCSATDLKVIVFGCVEKMFDAGLDVRALISDMGSNFVSFSKQLGINTNNCKFQVNGKILIYIFDAPHLMKCMRNLLLNHEVHFEDQIANWDPIEALYNMEKDKDLKMATKLTDAHIYPTSFQKMKVKYATQVFSSTVVSALSTYIANGKMSASAAGTAHFLEQFDHLFDILNSSTTKTTNRYRRPYTGSEDQEDFLIRMLDALKKIKVFSTTNDGKKDVTGTFKCISCFQITISSIMNLWQNLKNEGLQDMRTRRLNQDCIENFFGKIRQQGGNSLNPTPSQFMHAFKKLSCMDLLDCVDTFNCAADVDKLLMATVDLPSILEPNIRQPERTPFKV